MVYTNIFQRCKGWLAWRSTDLPGDIVIERCGVHYEADAIFSFKNISKKNIFKIEFFD